MSECFNTISSTIKEIQAICAAATVFEITEKKKDKEANLHDFALEKYETQVELFVNFGGIYGPLQSVFEEPMTRHGISKTHLLCSSQKDGIKYTGVGIWAKGRDIKTTIMNKLQPIWKSLLVGPNEDYPSGWNVESMIQNLLKRLYYVSTQDANKAINWAEVPDIQMPSTWKPPLGWHAFLFFSYPCVDLYRNQVCRFLLVQETTGPEPKLTGRTRHSHS